jgi:hypothetical protein
LQKIEESFMKASAQLTSIGLMVLLGACVAGLFLTGRSPNSDVRNARSRPPLAGQVPLLVEVDRRLLETARRLAALAITPEEQQLAQDAVRVADRELDTAFAIALRTAGGQPSVENPQTRAIEERIRRTETEIGVGQQKVQQLTAQAKNARGEKENSLQQRIEVLRAEISLDQDELADAKQDLIRAGGDARSRLQQLLEEHEAAQHANGTVRFGSGSSLPSSASETNLAAEWRNWSVLRTKQRQLSQAQQEAENRATVLSRNHETLEHDVREKQPVKKAAARQIAGSGSTSPPEGGGDSQAEATLSSLRHLSDDQKNLADLDKRIQDLQRLGAIYGQWGLLASDQTRLALHRVIESAL